MGSAGASPAVSGALAGNFGRRKRPPDHEPVARPAHRRGRRLAAPEAGAVPIPTAPSRLGHRGFMSAQSFFAAGFGPVVAAGLASVFAGSALVSVFGAAASDSFLAPAL